MRMVDLSHMMNLHTPGWVGITPEMVESARVEVKEGEILIIHTG